MSPHQPIDSHTILTYCRRYGGAWFGFSFLKTAFPVMQEILDRQTFDNLPSLVEFCAHPDNLEPMLADKADRVVISEALVFVLRKLMQRRVRQSTRSPQLFCDSMQYHEESSRNEE